MLGVSPEFVQNDISRDDDEIDPEIEQQTINMAKEAIKDSKEIVEDFTGRRKAAIELYNSSTYIMTKMVESPKGFLECYRSVVKCLKQNELSDAELLFNIINDNGISNNADVNFVKKIKNVKYSLRSNLLKNMAINKKLEVPEEPEESNS